MAFMVISRTMKTTYGWFILCSLVVASQTHRHGDDIHGGVPMGKINHKCDDAKTNIRVDWDDRVNVEHTCLTSDHGSYDTTERKSFVECLAKKDIPKPYHVCLPDPIKYKDIPPRAGSHRPLWPVYGEYLYLPPQRWVHSLEHGAAVFLYHPCAQPKQIERLKRLARGCLRRHIITPYRQLKEGYLFAVLTYGCRLQMTRVDGKQVVKFVKAHALEAPERKVFKDGQYNHGLLQKAAILNNDITDEHNVCRRFNGLASRAAIREELMFDRGMDD